MMTFAIVAAVVASISFLLTGGYYAYAAWVESRLGATALPEAAAPPSAPRSIARAEAPSGAFGLASLLIRLPGVRALDRLRIRTNHSTPLVTLLAPCALVTGLGVPLCLTGTLAVPALLTGMVITGWFPYAFLTWQMKRRSRRFQSQLPDALELVARSLRAGHPFLVGMKMVAEEFPDPMGREFGTVVEETTFGVTVSEALKGLASRQPSPDLQFFTTALAIQRETGGNLAEIIDSIGRLVRQRAELEGAVQALTAESRFSAGLLFVLPFVLGLVLFIFNPRYIRVLFTESAGRTMLAVAGLLLFAGVVVTRRLMAVKL
jgi:tight adherence protein B